MAGGWKLPENSINGTALSAANVANAHGADASYYNPAAMAFNEDGASFEAALTLIHLSGIEYSNPALSLSDETKVENIPVPSFHYVGPAMGNFRFGLSMVTPGGLSKRWKGFGKTSSEEFSLETMEINPTIVFKINDQFSMGGGVRAIYSKGVVKSDDQGPIFAASGGTLSPARDMEGDSWDFGYNLALHFKATDNLKLSATYRSKIGLTEEGTVTLSPSSLGLTPGLPTINTSASVSIPIPAAFSLAAAFDISDQTTVELVLERTYWSAYKDLDFNYPVNVFPYTSVFDDPAVKNWKDTNTLRIGVTHQMDSRWTVMGGFAYDKTPEPEYYVGFELPDSDAKIFSLGARYQYSDNLNIGAAFLYDKKDKLEIASSNSTLFTSATFEDAAAYLLTIGVNYTF
ncbi:OmpP1/FadL family transporter [Candidatus Vondammii sp. HM_W22]|uniref:OmpP1/FadL family transporter n=1 Tax=Candidatus Vondammii sp. HM_W22 TaxID=2687299 RepID=UPI001F1483C2|nr:OmpP1/FadL family transporter [Candidatus Vondammii sp. HM_W22]